MFTQFYLIYPFFREDFDFLIWFHCNVFLIRCGASFKIEIVSEQFEGKRLLERHRLVNSALAEEMKDIHALSITKALTPDQWKQQQQQESGNSQAAA